MWEMADTDGRHLAECFHNAVFSNEEPGVPYYERCARRSEDTASRVFPLERRVNFIYYYVCLWVICKESSSLGMALALTTRSRHAVQTRASEAYIPYVAAAYYMTVSLVPIPYFTVSIVAWLIALKSYWYCTSVHPHIAVLETFRVLSLKPRPCSRVSAVHLPSLHTTSAFTSKHPLQAHNSLPSHGEY
jgi:hypothetical protein